MSKRVLAVLAIAPFVLVFATGNSALGAVTTSSSTDIAITQPGNGNAVANAQVEIDGTAPANVLVSVHIVDSDVSRGEIAQQPNGGVAGTVTSGANGGWTFLPQVSLVPGRFTVQASYSAQSKTISSAEVQFVVLNSAGQSAVPSDEFKWRVALTLVVLLLAFAGVLFEFRLRHGRYPFQHSFERSRFGREAREERDARDERDAGDQRYERDHDGASSRAARDAEESRWRDDFWDPDARDNRTPPSHRPDDRSTRRDQFDEREREQENSRARELRQRDREFRSERDAEDRHREAISRREASDRDRDFRREHSDRMRDRAHEYESEARDRPASRRGNGDARDPERRRQHRTARANGDSEYPRDGESRGTDEGADRRNATSAEDRDDARDEKLRGMEIKMNAIDRSLADIADALERHTVTELRHQVSLGLKESAPDADSGAPSSGTT